MSLLGQAQGFTVLLEVIEVPEDYDEPEEVLEEALTLLNGRWNLDGSIIRDDDGKPWGWLYCTRFLVANETIRRTLGEMTPQYIRFFRGPPTQTSDDAIKLVKLKRKWKVQEDNTENSGETSEGGTGGATGWRKRPRF